MKMFSRVEPRFNEVAGDWVNLFDTALLCQCLSYTYNEPLTGKVSVFLLNRIKGFLLMLVCSAFIFCRVLT